MDRAIKGEFFAGDDEMGTASGNDCSMGLSIKEESCEKSSDAIFVDFEAVKNHIKEEIKEEDIKSEDPEPNVDDEYKEDPLESGSVVVMLPIKDEDITEVKEEVQDPLLMAGGC